MGTTTRTTGQEAVDALLSLAASLCVDFPELRGEVTTEAIDRVSRVIRRKSGALAESIQVVDTGVETHIFTNSRYAWPVHAGVPREGMAPNRFLLPLAYELDPTEIWERLAADRLEG